MFSKIKTFSQCTQDMYMDICIRSKFLQTSTDNKHPDIYRYMSIDLSISIYRSIFLSIYLSICLSIFLSIYPSVCLSIFLSIHLSVYLSFYPSVCLSIFLSIHLSVYLSFYLSIYLSIFLSICLSIFFVSDISGILWYLVYGYHLARSILLEIFWKDHLTLFIISI